MNHWSVTTITTIITLYALFGDDCKLAFFPKSADFTFNLITTLVLVLFVVEITINALSQESYFNSFYFWLDVISTVSLITDITWIWDQITGQTEDYEANDADQAGQLARAGRGARLGTRAGRIARVIRLIRLIRIGRLWKQANSRLNRARHGGSASQNEFAELIRRQRQLELMNKRKQLEISRKDMDKINRRVSVLAARR